MQPGRELQHGLDKTGRHMTHVQNYADKGVQIISVDMGIVLLAGGAHSGSVNAFATAAGAFPQAGMNLRVSSCIETAPCWLRQLWGLCDYAGANMQVPDAGSHNRVAADYDYRFGGNGKEC
mmetsp:Transcript_38541/g.81071  ORF Transcript_38541/g.81071 Transcript_38541/m.81071 type:complete len:121 (-) Transcript_38541:654-1016(-)